MTLWHNDMTFLTGHSFYIQDFRIMIGPDMLCELFSLICTNWEDGPGILHITPLMEGYFCYFPPKTLKSYVVKLYDSCCSLLRRSLQPVWLSDGPYFSHSYHCGTCSYFTNIYQQEKTMIPSFRISMQQTRIICYHVFRLLGSSFPIMSDCPRAAV